MEKVKRLGLGTMSMCRKNKEGAVRTIHAALDAGMDLFNTGDFYQGGESEMILGEAMQGIPRDSYFLSVKFGALPSPEGRNYGLDVTPHHVKGYLTYSLRRLNMDYIDLYQPGRLDTEISVEAVVEAIAGLVSEGYVRNIGLSHVTADELRRAHAIHPIHTVELSYSLIERDIENDLIATAEELGIRVLVHGITAKGLLRDDILDKMLCVPAASPLLRPAHKEKNLELVYAVKAIADSKGMTLSQLALAWALSKYPDMQCLVGTANPEHLQGFIDGLQFSFTDKEIKDIETAISAEKVSGNDSQTVVFTNGVWTVK